MTGSLGIQPAEKAPDFYPYQLPIIPRSVTFYTIGVPGPGLDSFTTIASVISHGLPGENEPDNIDLGNGVTLEFGQEHWTTTLSHGEIANNLSAAPALRIRIEGGETSRDAARTRAAQLLAAPERLQFRDSINATFKPQPLFPSYPNSFAYFSGRDTSSDPLGMRRMRIGLKPGSGSDERPQISNVLWESDEKMSTFFPDPEENQFVYLQREVSPGRLRYRHAAFPL
jgi:hypothetical protein